MRGNKEETKKPKDEQSLGVNILTILRSHSFSTQLLLYSAHL